MSNQSTRVGKAPQTASQLRSDLVINLRSNTTTVFTTGNLLIMVSSLGEAGLKIINPNACEEETGNFVALAFLGHEAEVHFHSLELELPVGIICGPHR